MGRKVVILKWTDGRRIFSKQPLRDEHDVKRAVALGTEYNPDSYEVVDYVDPCDGGCWFCCTAPEDQPMLFDTEFDTNLHGDCLREALQRDPNHPEARIMAYLLKEEN